MRNDNYNRRIEQILQLEREGQVFVLRPSEEISISRYKKTLATCERFWIIVSVAYSNSTERLTNFANASPFSWPAASIAISMSWWIFSEEAA